MYTFLKVFTARKGKMNISFYLTQMSANQVKAYIKNNNCDIDKLLNENKYEELSYKQFCDGEGWEATERFTLFSNDGSVKDILSSSQMLINELLKENEKNLEF